MLSVVQAKDDGSRVLYLEVDRHTTTTPFTYALYRQPAPNLLRERGVSKVPSEKEVEDYKRKCERLGLKRRGGIPRAELRDQ